MWSRELIESLLSQYAKYENLYDVRHRDYLNRVKRSQSLFEICESLKPMEKSVTVAAIKTKIHGMRSQYLKEVNAIKGSKRSGAGADDVYVPKLWWFSLMEFLIPHVNSRPSSSNLSEDNKENESNEFDDIVDDSDSMPSTSQSFAAGLATSSQNANCATPSQSSKKRKVSVAFAEKLGGVKSLLQKRMKENTEYEWLTKLIEFEFANIEDKTIKRETAWSIQNLLRDAVIRDSAKRLIQPPNICATPTITPTQIPRSRDILQQSLIGILNDDSE